MTIATLGPDGTLNMLPPVTPRWATLLEEQGAPQAGGSRIVDLLAQTPEAILNRARGEAMPSGGFAGPLPAPPSATGWSGGAAIGDQIALAAQLPSTTPARYAGTGLGIGAGVPVVPLRPIAQDALLLPTPVRTGTEAVATFKPPPALKVPTVPVASGVGAGATGVKPGAPATATGTIKEPATPKPTLTIPAPTKGAPPGLTF